MIAIAVLSLLIQQDKFAPDRLDSVPYWFWFWECRGYDHVAVKSMRHRFANVKVELVEGGVWVIYPGSKEGLAFLFDNFRGVVISPTFSNIDPRYIFMLTPGWDQTLLQDATLTPERRFPGGEKAFRKVIATLTQLKVPLKNSELIWCQRPYFTNGKWSQATDVFCDSTTRPYQRLQIIEGKVFNCGKIQELPVPLSSPRANVGPKRFSCL